MKRFLARTLCCALLGALPGPAAASAAACLQHLDAGDQRRAAREEQALAPADRSLPALMCRARLRLFPDPAANWLEENETSAVSRSELALALLGLEASRPADRALQAAMAGLAYERVRDPDRARPALETAGRLRAGADARVKRLIDVHLLARRLETTADPESEEKAVADLGSGFVEGHYLRVALDHLLAEAYARAGRPAEAGAALSRAYEGTGKGMADAVLERAVRTDLFNNLLLRGDLAGARRLLDAFDGSKGPSASQLHALRGRLYEREERWREAADERLQAYDALPAYTNTTAREALLSSTLTTAQALRDNQAFADAEDVLERVRERAQSAELDNVLDAHVESLSLLALEWRAHEPAAARRLASDIEDLARDAGTPVRRAWADWVAARFAAEGEIAEPERRRAARRFARLGDEARGYFIDRGLLRVKEGWTRAAVDMAERQCLGNVASGDFLKRYVETYAPEARPDAAAFRRYAAFFAPFCTCKIEAVASARSNSVWQTMSEERREQMRERSDRQCETGFIEAADTLKNRGF